MTEYKDLDKDFLMKKHTILEWDSCFGIVTMDPDGFDRKDSSLMERTFTLKEYRDGMFRSTCMWGRFSKEKLDRAMEEVYVNVLGTENSNQDKEKSSDYIF